MVSKAILVVDDDANLRRTLSDILEFKGYSPIPVGSGRAALETLSTQSVNVVILDLRLEDMTGLELMAAIKQRAPYVECVLLTGNASQASAIEAINMGAYSYMQKPYDIDRLLLIIQHAIEKQEAEQALRESQNTLSTLMGNLPGMAYRSRNDEAWTMEFISQGCLELTGYSPDDLIGNSETTYGQLIHPNDRQYVWDSVQAALASGIHFEIEYRIVTASGEVKWVWERGIQITSPDSNEVFLEGFISDVTQQRNDQEALKESQLRYSNLFNYSLNGIALHEIVTNQLGEPIDYRFIEVNHAFEILTGLKAEEIIGKRVTEILPGVENDPFIQIYGQVVLTGEPNRFEQFTTPLQKYFEVAAFSTLPGQFAAVFTDTTDRKRAEEELQQYARRLETLLRIDQAILNAQSPQAIAEAALKHTQDILPCKSSSVSIFDPVVKEFHIIAANPSVSKSVLQGGARIPASDPDVLNALLNDEILVFTDMQAFPVPDWVKDDLLANQIGSVMIVPLTARFELIGSLAIRREEGDAIEEHEIEIARQIAPEMAVAIQHASLNEQIRQYAEELEMRVVQRTEELQVANQELRDFAYVVSHDLKAPLRGISQLSNWIVTDYADSLDEEGREMLNLLTERTRHMHRLIDGILMYSRVGRVKETKQLVDLEALVQETVEVLSPPEHIQVTLECNAPPVMAQPTLITQVIQNLLGNAIKFADKPDSWVKLSCRDDEQQWLFSVADNGPGIDAQYHANIFQMFQTLNAEEDHDSTGIGLALVKKIVEGWGGRIWLESTPGEGSTFFFTLPKETAGDETS